MAAVRFSPCRCYWRRWPRHPGAAAAAAGSPTPQPSASAATDEVLGTLTFRAFDLGFDPATIEVEHPGRYAISFVNDGAVLHNITFADGTVVEAEAGKTAEGEVVVPAEGLGTFARSPGTPTGAWRARSAWPAGTPRFRTPAPRRRPARTPPSIPTRMRRSTRPVTPPRRQWRKAVYTTSTWSSASTR